MGKTCSTNGIKDAYKIRKPNDKTSIGKFRHRKTDSIKMYPGKIKCENVD
jgi:hypothetical protein